MSPNAQEALAALGASVLRQWHNEGERGDLDGGWIQEEAARLGVLVPVERTEPCGDTCVCAEYADPPFTCYEIRGDIWYALHDGHGWRP